MKKRTIFTVKMIAEAWYNGNEMLARDGLNDAGANPQLDVFETDPAEVVANETVKNLFWILSKKDGRNMDKQPAGKTLVDTIGTNLKEIDGFRELINQQSDVQATLAALEGLGQACARLAEIIKKAAGIDDQATS